MHPLQPEGQCTACGPQVPAGGALAGSILVIVSYWTALYGLTALVESFM
jgi:hypothetical protein